MRVGWIIMLMLAGCGDGQPDSGQPVTCGQNFCVPSAAKLIPTRQVASFEHFGDFNTFQMQWRGSHFDIYEGNFPDLYHGEVERISIPLDADAEFHISGDEGHIKARIGDDWPRFVGVRGPCSSRTHCAAAEAATALTRR
jgi:hypothetical protein